VPGGCRGCRDRAPIRGAGQALSDIYKLRGLQAAVLEQPAGTGSAPLPSYRRHRPRLHWGGAAEHPRAGGGEG